MNEVKTKAFIDAQMSQIRRKIEQIQELQINSFISERAAEKQIESLIDKLEVLKQTKADIENSR